MALLETMPPVEIPSADLESWGRVWATTRAFDKKNAMDFGRLLDQRVGAALARMLGGIDIIEPSQTDLLPEGRDVVEVGSVRVVGGIRPQNFNVGYRPDGVRFAFDGKTLNDEKSISKNFQNMVNDLGTEATSVHIRFPHAVVAFMVVLPTPCFTGSRRERFTRMLERLVGRSSPIDLAYKAEAVSLVLWNPGDGTIDKGWPLPRSPLRIERFSEQVQRQYKERYDGMPPHDRPSEAQKAVTKECSDDARDSDDGDDASEAVDGAQPA